MYYYMLIMEVTSVEAEVAFFFSVYLCKQTKNKVS